MALEQRYNGDKSKSWSEVNHLRDWRYKVLFKRDENWEILTTRKQRKNPGLENKHKTCQKKNWKIMKREVKSAVDFLTNILRTGDVSQSQTEMFNSTLIALLCDRYHNHWFPEKPFKGSGFRCIRLNHNLDPLIIQAGQMSGLDSSVLGSVFPPELTMWVDPREVSYRFGENGSVGVLYDSSNQSTKLNQNQSNQELTQHSSTMDNSQHLQQQWRPSAMDNFNSSFLTCKEQFLSSLPISRETVNRSFAGFVAS